MEFSQEQNFPAQPRLTEREIEILKLLCDGLTPIEIAEKTHTSKRTVDTHKTNIMAKFQVSSVTKLIVSVYKNKFFEQ